MKELDLLEKYLIDKAVIYDRTPTQIIVYSKHGTRLWDVICQKGSYGYEEGLLEAMGSPIVKWSDGDSVVGYLTAQDVINRLEESDGD